MVLPCHISSLFVYLIAFRRLSYLISWLVRLQVVISSEIYHVISLDISGDYESQSFFNYVGRVGQYNTTGRKRPGRQKDKNSSGRTGLRTSARADLCCEYTIEHNMEWNLVTIFGIRIAIRAFIVRPCHDVSEKCAHVSMQALT